MGERLLCKQEVDGSIPFTSTRLGIAAGAGLGAAERFHAALVGEFELGPSYRLGNARFAYPGPGWPKLGAVSRCFSIFLSNAGVGRVFALFVIVDRFVGRGP